MIVRHELRVIINPICTPETQKKKKKQADKDIPCPGGRNVGITDLSVEAKEGRES